MFERMEHRCPLCRFRGQSNTTIREAHALQPRRESPSSRRTCHRGRRRSLPKPPHRAERGGLGARMPRSSCAARHVAHQQVGRRRAQRRHILLIPNGGKLPVTKHTAAGRSAVPSSVARRSTPLLLLASVVQAAEPPTYSPCPVIDRPGHIAEDGSIRKERSPQELAAAALEYCDIVAWGRFVSVCDENYHRTTGVLNAEVTVKFAVDDTLIGERHEFVRTRMQRLMLVWPDTDLSWDAHQAVSNRGRLQREEAAARKRGCRLGVGRLPASGVRPSSRPVADEPRRDHVR